MDDNKSLLDLIEKDKDEEVIRSMADAYNAVLYDTDIRLEEINDEIEHFFANAPQSLSQSDVMMIGGSLGKEAIYEIGPEGDPWAYCRGEEYANIIAHAPKWLRWLVTEVKTLRARETQLQEQLDDSFETPERLGS